jgi:hypothetical protein
MLSFLYKNYTNLIRSDSSSGFKPALSSNYYSVDKNLLTFKTNIPCKNSLPISAYPQDYCIKLTNASIIKVSESYNKDKNATIKTKFNNFNVITKDELQSPDNLLGYMFCLLSSTTFAYYFYKISWLNMFSFNRYIDVSRK